MKNEWKTVKPRPTTPAFNRGWPLSIATTNEAQPRFGAGKLHLEDNDWQKNVSTFPLLSYYWLWVWRGALRLARPGGFFPRPLRVVVISLGVGLGLVSDSTDKTRAGCPAREGRIVISLNQLPLEAHGRPVRSCLSLRPGHL